MDKTKLIGFGLILGLVWLWAYMNAPTAEEIEAKQRALDSIEALNQVTQIEPTAFDSVPLQSNTAAPAVSDSVKQLMAQQQYGVFAQASSGTEEIISLENDVVKIDFNTKGGRIVNATLKQHFKSIYDEENNKTLVPVQLLEDEKNNMYFSFRTNDGKKINTDDLYFTGIVRDSILTLTAPVGTGGGITQRFVLSSDNYHLDHTVRTEGLRNIIDDSDRSIAFHWTNYPDRLERNTSYEANYSSIYFKESGDDVDNCSCTGDDVEESENKKLDWVSHNNQFFNSTIMSATGFTNARNETVRLDESEPDLKKYITDVQIPADQPGEATLDLDWYIGPNEYARLKAYDNDLEYVIPYGSSIFGTINRYIIRPIFNILNGWIGVVLGILLLTFIVKLVLYPLSYKMYKSQAKMRALKPELDAVREKFADEPQKMQMEVMKEQGKYGVNMAQGCLPMVLQMPIWFALYRFFPANIDFRQQSFLWAAAFSSYEVFAHLPLYRPFYGSHVPVFDLLSGESVFIYSLFNQSIN